MNARRINTRARGFTLVEAAVSSVLVGVLLVASLQALAAARMARYKNAELARATLLADGLLNEIRALPYSDPAGSSILGYDFAENGVWRGSFDDVDDFNGWTESPPQLPDGTPMDGYDSWSRSVRVYWCNPASPSGTSGAETGLKRIVVVVNHHGVPVATATAIKANLN